MIETAIDQESRAIDREIGANSVVLDDVTPRYARATAALSTCHASLGAALEFLLETRTPEPRVAGAAERWLPASV